MKQFAKMIIDMGGGKSLKNQKKSNCYFLKISNLVKKNKKDNIIATLCICCVISAIVFCYLDLKEKNDYLEFSQHFDIQTEKEDKSVYSLLGFDIRGQVQFTTNGILRTTCESYLDIAKKTFEKYKNFAKDHSDIVETKMEGFNFIHKRYITTCPAPL